MNNKVFANIHYHSILAKYRCEALEMIWKSLLITFTNETIQQQWSFLLPPSLSPLPPLLILPSHRFKVRCFVWIWICDDVWRRYQDGSVEQIDNIYYVYNLLVSKEWKIQFQEYKINKDSKKDGGNNGSSCIINNYSFGVSASTLSLPSVATPTLGITTFTHLIFPNRYHSSVWWTWYVFYIMIQEQ